MTNNTDNTNDTETPTNKYIKDFTPKAKQRILEFFRKELKTSHLDSLENNPEAYINEVLDKVTPCFDGFDDPIYELSQFDTKTRNPELIDFCREDFIYADE